MSAGSACTVAYPVLNIDLSSLKGRQECYDIFCHFCLKTEQYFSFCGNFLNKFLGKEIEKAKRKLMIINSTASTYKALREVFFGPNWAADMGFVTANDQLNKILANIPTDEFSQKVSEYLKIVQQNSLVEAPPTYNEKVPL